MSEALKMAIKRLTAAFEQQQHRRPLEDSDTLAVYYGDLRRLVEAASNPLVNDQ